MKKTLLAAVLAGLVLAPAGASAQPHDGEDRRVRIVNNSWFAVTAVYAVPSRHRARTIRSKDWIPATTIGSGTSYSVNFDRGDRTCRYDIRATGSNGRDWITRGFNVCRRDSWRLVN